MNTIYLETSAALNWLLQQKNYERVTLFLEKAEQIVTSLLTLWECKRGISRLYKENKISPAHKNKFLGTLNQTAGKWTLMEISSEIQAMIAEPFPLEPVRTLDAIHLATALEFSKSFPDLKVLTLDQRITANLEPLGLASVKL